ncbi:MobV family relaxase [Shewanella sp. SM65]|uniref:MobV family relaxase n=1 Tax=Shewanella sp. SM65 TaxID=2912803 RepID=UPI0021D9780E|nr:MobV family relaxase [Shewanella sp. SM65]MCU8050111.1 plasmid recombination protein [Shewanella sp. SM65]
MPKFAILRIQKHHNLGTVAGMSSHVHRQRPTPNADPLRLHQNRHFVGSTSWVSDVKNRLDAAGVAEIRKNGVIAIEHMLSASPEWFFNGSIDEQNQRANAWLKSSRTWLEGTYGKENLVSLSVHLDESTPHIHAMVVPIEHKIAGRFAGQNRLNAKKWCDGRKALADMQTSYARAVEHLGLERGIAGSPARHETMKNLGAKAEKRLAEEKAKAKIEVETEVREKMSKEIIQLRLNPDKVLNTKQLEEYQFLERQKQELINQISNLKAAAALPPSPAKQNAFKPK